jgi:hypothetical protein
VRLSYGGVRLSEPFLPCLPRGIIQAAKKTIVSVADMGSTKEIWTDRSSTSATYSLAKLRKELQQCEI